MIYATYFYNGADQRKINKNTHKDRLGVPSFVLGSRDSRDTIKAKERARRGHGEYTRISPGARSGTSGTFLWSRRLK